MKNNTKRLVSALICLALVLAVLPMAVFAAGTTLYCAAPDSWEVCNAYAWNDDSNNSWPGVPMTKNDDGIWVVELDAAYTKVIFNNGAGAQSADLDMPTDSNVQFNYIAGTWGPYDANVEAPVVENVTVYVQIPDSWGAPSIHFWGSAVDGTSWPGVAMTATEGNIYSYAIPSDCTGLLFHDGTGDEHKTGDLTVPTDANVLYNVENAAWGPMEGGSEGTQATEPAGTTAPTEPAGTTAPTEPAGTTAPTEPAGTTAPTDPVGTTAPTNKPAGTTPAPTDPAGTTAPTTKPAGTTKPATTTPAPTEPAATGVTVTATVPENWTDVNLYAWKDGGANNANWPGQAMTAVTRTGGKWTITLSSVDFDRMIVNGKVDGAAVQTKDLEVEAGKNVNIVVGEKDGDKFGAEVTSTGTAPAPTNPTTAPGGATTAPTTAPSGATTAPTTAPTQAPATSVTVTATVPATWTDVCIWAWRSSDNSNAFAGTEWPGQPMTKSGDKWTVTIPATDVDRMIINGKVDGAVVQTVDLNTVAGKNTEVVIGAAGDDGKFTAEVTYNGTAAPGPVDPSLKGVHRVTGNAEWMGNWDPASDKGLMTEVSDGVYEITFKNVPVGNYEFKITKDGVWDNAWGDGGKGGQNNIPMIVSVAGDVTVRLNVGTGALSYKTAASGEWVPVTGDMGIAAVCAALLFASAGLVCAVSKKKEF